MGSTHQSKRRSFKEVEPAAHEVFAQGALLHMNDADRASFTAAGADRIEPEPDWRQYYEFVFHQLTPGCGAASPRAWCRVLAARDRSSPSVVAVVWHPENPGESAEAP